MKCIFCEIAAKKIPAKIIYEDDIVLAFNDINPQAPIHTLIIPHTHINSINDINEENKFIFGHMILVAKNLVKQLKIDESGYRTVMNCNQDGGQEVFHVHLHLLGGRRMLWPPG
jgi:histidine triad (HIT) family protein